MSDAHDGWGNPIEDPAFSGPAEGETGFQVADRSLLSFLRRRCGFTAPLCGECKDADSACQSCIRWRRAIEEALNGLVDANNARAVLVYARDCLDHTAKFNGIDWTLLRKVIGKVLGDPAPEVGSTFAQVMAIDRYDYSSNHKEPK